MNQACIEFDVRTLHSEGTSRNVPSCTTVLVELQHIRYDPGIPVLEKVHSLNYKTGKKERRDLLGPTFALEFVGG